LINRRELFKKAGVLTGITLLIKPLAARNYKYSFHTWWSLQLHRDTRNYGISYTGEKLVQFAIIEAQREDYAEAFRGASQKERLKAMNWFYKNLDKMPPHKHNIRITCNVTDDNSNVTASKTVIIDPNNTGPAAKEVQKFYDSLI